MFTIYLCAKCHMSHQLSLWNRKLKHFGTKFILIFHIVQKYDPNKSYMVTKGLLITPFKDLEINGTSAVSRLQVRASAILL